MVELPLWGLLSAVLAPVAVAVLWAAANRSGGRREELSQEGVLKALSDNANSIREMTEQSLNRHFTNIDRKLSENSRGTDSLLKGLGERLTVAEVLNRNVENLRRILSDKRERGAFGEMRLEQLVKDQLPPQFYQFQAPVGADGNRVDCLIKLPRPQKPICIDAKFPLAERPQTEDEAQQSRKNLEIALKKHIDQIAAKYIVSGETAPHAGMFFPNEGVYMAVHEELPQVIQYAHKKRVVILSPTSMWLTLNTMASIIRDAQIHEKAKLLQREIGMLLEDSRRVNERCKKLQGHFDSAREDLDDLGLSVKKVGDRSDKITSMDFEEDKKLE